jgi:hypothetical protein
MLAVPVCADYVVLQTESELFGIGALLEDDAELRLADGERIILLSENGNVVEIHGPYEGLPEGNTVPEIDMRVALTNLIDNADDLHASLGSTRGGVIFGGQTAHRDVWQLDALRSGRQCVVDGNAIEFWRADTGEELTLEMQRPGTEGVAVINWPVGVAEAPWPVSMPLVNEALYVLRRAGWTEAALIRVMVLNPEVVQHSQTAIAWLAAHGCSRQAELLMSDLE